ncbi:XAC2610-related protein [Pseudomonas sp. KCJK9016]|uniref:XAC2610-related protein n=1 Tax=Pseudomonas sp. KCJK9016 TaxID=3344556 RepID=UPI003906BC83
MRSKALAVSLLGLLWTMPALAETTTFSPTQGVEATLVLEGSKLSVAAKGGTHNESRTIDFQAENELHLQIDDFNFDGAKDFAVRQLDDGMGTYDYYRVFIYQARTGTFEELRPDCGDGFVNLRVDKKRKALLSTYWEMNVAKQCVTRFAKRKA